MKRVALWAVLVWTLFGMGAVQAQDQAMTEGTDPQEQVATTEADVPTPVQLTMQQQIDELRAKLAELEAQLADSKETNSREVYAINDAQSKFAVGNVKISGYIQSQYTHDEALSVEDDFRVRRARVKFEAPVSDLASATLEIDATRTVELKEAFIDLFGRPTDLGRLRFGQAKVPIMYDIVESSSTRLAPEQTALAQYLFPGEYDQGVWFRVNNLLGDQIPGTTLDVGAQNGQGPNTGDLNNNKDLLARVRFVLGDCPPDKVREANSVYVSYLNGDFSTVDSQKLVRTTPKRYYGAGVSYQLGPLWIRSEYQTGEKLGADFRGWHGQLAYGLPTAVDTPFVRYDVLDQNTALPNASYADWTFGWQHFLDPKIRLVLAYESRHPETKYSSFSTTDGGLTTLRLQVKF